MGSMKKKIVCILKYISSILFKAWEYEIIKQKSVTRL